MQQNGKDMWSSLLDSVANGKRHAEKTLILMGGSPETQNGFLDILASDTFVKPQERYRKKPPVANALALGYTYQDILDADHEDILARLSIYTLQAPSLSFAHLVTPLLTQQSVSETLLVIVLDWIEPWTWVRRLRDWTRLLREVLASLDNDTKGTMANVMREWKQRRRGLGAQDIFGSEADRNDATTTTPLGPGEWDEALGLPLCVVCHNSDKIDILETKRGWREEEFDYVLQFLRTILLKYGASLIYTSNSAPNSLPTLIHTTLGVHSLLKRQPLRYNVVERDRILIPSNWDSWGKITVLREGFDTETVSKGWTVDCLPLQNRTSHKITMDDNVHEQTPEQREQHWEEHGPLLLYEEAIQGPKDSINLGLNLTRRLEARTPSMQDFLAGQMEAMERMRAEEERAQGKEDAGANPESMNYGTTGNASGFVEERNRVNEHIGPVQFNMGGIQVDAEDMLRKLKDRERKQVSGPTAPVAAVTPDGKKQNEALANFFADLIKRGGSNSPRQAPA